MKKFFYIEGTEPYNLKVGLKMKLTVFLTIVSLFQIQANTYSQNKKISLDMSNATVEEVIQEIESLSDFKFLLNRKDVDLNRVVSIIVEKQKIATVLSELFEGTDVGFEVLNKQIILKRRFGKMDSSKNSPVAEVNVQFEVSGTVTDANGAPLPGASILEKGTTNGVQTDFDGNFSIGIANEDVTLVFSYIGFANKEVPVNGQTTVNVQLEESAQGLDEVVVVGYSEKRQSELSSSVAIVDEKELEKGVVSQDLGSMLQGKVAGLTISNSEGAPGSNANIVIRGVGSIGANSSPLYVVDGVIGGTANPRDIASITVLKDAAATGLYGSRAANGVIVITTKSGESGKTKISYSGSFGPTFFRKGNIEMMNSRELYERQREGFRNFYDEQVAASNPGFTDTDFETYLGNVLPSSLLNTDTDWQSLLSRAGYVNQQQISVSGGTDKTTFYASGNYFFEQGTILSTSYRNMDFRTNLKHKISDKTTLQIRINAGADKKPNEPLPGQEGTMAQFYNNVPWDPAFEADGITPYNPSGPGNTWIGNASSNYFYNRDHQSDITKSRRYGIDLQLEFEITDWMKFSTTNSVGHLSSDHRQFLDKYHQLANFENGRISETVAENNTFFTSNLLRLNHSYGNHNLAGILGQEYNYIKDSFTGAVGIDLAEGLTALNASASPKSVSGDITETGFKSFFGQLDYNYNGKYFLVGSLRSDASSRFGKNNRWATFYSVGGSWNINRENFLSDIEWLDLLKFRASYGTTGNANISPYLSLGTYSFSDASTYNGISGARPSRLENPDLTWEIAHTTNLGLQFSSFNRISLELDFYNRENKSVLQGVPLSSASGFLEQQRNVGSVRNRGLDVNLSTVNLDGEFRWETNFNVNLNRNKVLSLNQGQDIASGNMRIREGQALRYFYMKEWAGVDPQTGDALWVRWEDDQGNLIQGADNKEPAQILTTNSYNEASNLFVRSAYPHFTGGVRSDMFYKNFSLSMLFNFAEGQSIYFGARERIDADNNSLNQNQMKLYKDWVRWEQPGDIATHPKLLSGGSTSNGTSSRYLEKSSYLRFQNVRLGYNFPQENNLFSNLELYANIDYVAVFTKFSGADPDVDIENSVINQAASSARYSPPRRILLGIRLDF